MPKKTIAFVTYILLHGGAERVLTTLANHLSKKYNVIVITLKDHPSFYPLHPEIQHLNCGLAAESSSSGLTRIREYFSTLKILKRIIKDYNVDLVVSFMTVVNIFSILAAKQTKTPCIISERNNPIANPPTRFWRTLRNLTYRYCSILIVQTKANGLFYEAFTPSEKVHIVPNPLSKELASKRILPRTKNAEIKNILSVGRLDKNKSQDLLIRAFANIENQGWKVIIVGEGNEETNYRNLAQELNIQDKIELVGSQKKIWDFYNNADIFSFTSKSEGFPNALIEALYFGVPSVSTDCPHGPSELIQHGINGFLIPVGDQEKLEYYLKKMMPSENLRRAMSTEALALSKEYEADEIMNIWETHIEELLSDA